MKKSVRKSAREKAMDYLAVRDHSREELRKKLLQKDYTPSEINKTLDEAETSGWLVPSEALSAKVSEILHRKKKEPPVHRRVPEVERFTSCATRFRSRARKSRNFVEILLF